jgi:DNA ligase-1
MGHLLVANTVYERVCVPLQSMKDRYSEDSENCSKLPLWGDVQVGGTSGGLLSSGSRITLWLLGYSPSVYFRPHEVWEIRGAE